jgi:hypothetical protein
MNQVRKFKLNNNLTYLAASVLMICFLLSFILVFFPNFPAYPRELEDWRWSVTSWNLAGPLMFIIVFRIQALRHLSESIQKVRGVGITPWVWFWFMAAVFFGVVTFPQLIRSYIDPSAFEGHSSAAVYSNVLTSVTIVSWFIVIALSLSLFHMKGRYPKSVLRHLRKAQDNHRWLLAISSAVFFIFTGLSSLAILVSF